MKHTLLKVVPSQIRISTAPLEDGDHISRNSKMTDGMFVVPRTTNAINLTNELSEL